MSLIACVPNISEGRRPDVIQRLSEAVSGVRGVRLLNVASDREQNRSLITFIGTATPLRKAVCSLMQAAIEEIDIRKHRGKHPRMGAVDVIPFVPIRGTSMEKCVKLSRAVGKEVGESFAVPVYLYEESATDPSRVSISDIREGEFEGFARRIKRPEWLPDFGPARVHPTAGVVAVGARHLLIAFNMTLEGAGHEAVERIVEAIRASGYGSRQVKAIVLDESPDGVVKIAVSLFNYKETPIHTVLEAAQREAKRFGARVASVEMVGLVTADALVECLRHYMHLVDFDPLQFLEFHFPRSR